MAQFYPSRDQDLSRKNTNSAGSAAVSKQRRVGERRPMTVVFVDLVGSTEIGERLDPEDLLEVIRQYRAFCAELLTKFGGTIGQFVGDGILAYFSFPIAHENDPERAVRACLAIKDGIGQLTTPANVPLSVRLGVATGLVVVSDITEGTLEKNSIIGSTPNLAARLQGLAGPNEIVVSETTHQRISDRFKCLPIVATKLHGFADAHSPWRVLRVSTRPFARVTSFAHMTSFHGRDKELTQLAQFWQRTLDGYGTAAMVQAGAGMGKTRLLQEVIERHVGHDSLLLHLQASPLDKDTPLFPFREGLRNLLGVTEAKSLEFFAEALSASWSDHELLSKDAAPLVANLLGLPVANADADVMRPEALRERTIAAISSVLLARAQKHPACIIVEDLHWLDPTSITLLERLLTEMRSSRLLLLMSARVEFEPHWSNVDLVDVIQLSPLQKDTSEAMLSELFADKEVPLRLIQELGRNTDGIPLFVEETARELLRSEATVEEQTAERLFVPASLHELLVAHLDRAGVAKEIAQLASVIGIKVDTKVLRQAAGIDNIDERVAILVDQGILRTRKSGTLEFAHSLLREAAYESLLRENRKSLHADVSVALESVYPDIAKRHPETLALHMAGAGSNDQAIELWIEAAKRALQSASLTEARRILRRSLLLLESLPDRADRIQRQLDVIGLLGPVLIATRGSQTEETQALYSRGLELTTLSPTKPAHFPIAWGWWRVSKDFNTHLVRATSLLESAKRSINFGRTAHLEQMLQAHHCCWASYYHAADFERSELHLRKGLAVYGQGDFRHHAQLYGNHDARACAKGEFARIRWMQGRLKASVKFEDSSLAWARKLKHLGSLVHALDSALFVSFYRRDLNAVRSISAELIELTAQHDIADHGLSGHILDGWVTAITSDPKSGLRRIQEGLSRHREIATYEDFPVYACILAEAFLVNGKPERAYEELTHELEEFDRIGIKVWRPEVLRMQAVAAQTAGFLDRTIKLLTQAEELAVRQATPMFRLRNAMSHAEIPDQFRDREHAAIKLARALAAVPESDNSVDIVGSRLMLETLREKNR